MILTTHVDDIECAGPPSELKKLRTVLEGKFGKMKTQEASFLHCGVMYEPRDQGFYMHQEKLVEDLQYVLGKAKKIIIDSSSINLD